MSSPTRNRRKQKFIAIPNVYPQPKYRFGQIVKQGRIIGMEFFPPDMKISDGEDEKWHYWVSEDEDSLGLKQFSETEIEPLTAEELQTLVKDEIDFHNSCIAVLKEQLL